MREKFTEIHYEVSVAPLTQSLNYGYPSKEMQRLLNEPEIKMVNLYEGFTNRISFDFNHWQRAGRKITRRVQRSSRLIEKLLARSEKIRKRVIGQLHVLDWAKVPDYSNAKLTFLLKSFAKDAFLLSTYSQLGAVADHYHYTFSDQLEKTISSAEGKSQVHSTLNEIISLLNAPVHIYSSDIARKELLNIKNQSRKASHRKERLLKKHLSRWFWLTFGQMGPGMMKQDLLKELKSEISVHNTKAIRKSQQVLTRKLCLDRSGQNLFKASRAFIFLKGARVEAVNGICAFVHRVLDKIQKETGVQKQFLLFCTVNEILGYLSGKHLPGLAELRSRYKYSFWNARSTFDIRILTGRKARNFEKTRVIGASEVAKKGYLTVAGRVAYSGLAVGKVKIINEPHEMKKMKKGDVLVAIQTTPELVPAMKKASAFVTDIGGITSHAALVAREFKVPCIVGAKIATKVLRDGMLVQVDANAGLVKIIK